jgi:hypothetical protein
MLKQSYWKVVLRYGHVGHGNEVCVARYLAFDEGITLLEVYDFAKNMPGVKSTRGVNSAKKVDYSEYCTGKEAEESNFYLQKLMSFNQNLDEVA